MSEPPLNDPVFYDTSIYVPCIECKELFDCEVYFSKTCPNCEDKQVERARANATTL